MRGLARLWPLLFVSGAVACSFLLDFDELQSGPGPDASVGGSGGSSGASGSGGTAITGGAAGSAGSAGAAGDASTSIPIEQLGYELAQAICANAKQCYGPAIDILTQGLDCVQLYQVGLEDTVIGLVQKSLDGGITYDGDAAAQCIAALNAATRADSGLPSCVDPYKYFEQCKDVFGNAGDAGATCNSTFECADGLFCDTLTACPGTCAAFLDDGAACQDTKQCKPGSVCYVAADGGDAGIGTCQPYTPPGSACNAWAPQEPPCAPGSICSGGKCRLAQTYFSNAITAQCGGFLGTKNLCGSGLACEFDGIPLLSDGTCVTDTDHAGCKLSVPDSCGPGKYCNAPAGSTTGGSCVNIPDQDGDPCAKDQAQGYGFAPACGDGLRCVNGQCKTVARIGEGCINNEHCGSTICKNAPDAGGSDAGPGTCELPACY
jgi:hypothetical protein